MNLPLKARIVGEGARNSDKKPPHSRFLVAGMALKDIHVAGAAAALYAVVLGFAGSASAQQRTAPAQPSPPPAAPGSSLSFGPSRASTAPPAAKYEDTVTNRAFVLDRSGQAPLMKFDDSQEIVPLQVTTGQRGDDFLRTPDGQLVLRITELGNVIAYFSSKNGAPADIVGVAAPLDAPAMPSTLTDRVKDAAAKLGKLAGHDVTIFGAGEFARNEKWTADALNATVIGVQRANGLSNTTGQKLKAVRLMRAAAASADLRDGELILGVNPDLGDAGRPTPEAVAQAMTAKRSGL